MRTIKFGQTNGTIILKENSIVIKPIKLLTPDIIAGPRVYNGILDAYETTLNIKNPNTETVTVYWGGRIDTYPTTEQLTYSVSVPGLGEVDVVYNWSFDVTVYFRAQARLDEYISSNTITDAY